MFASFSHPKQHPLALLDQCVQQSIHHLHHQSSQFLTHFHSKNFLKFFPQLWLWFPIVIPPSVYHTTWLFIFSPL